MLYECNVCKALIPEADVKENSLGDPACPECGSTDISKQDISEYGN